MSVEDERDLRVQLAGLLDGVDVRPAPVAATVRRGRRIRIRRRVFALVGLAVVGTVAAALPSVFGGLPDSARPLAQTHYSVRVHALRPIARAGVIAAGVTDGKQWKVVGSVSTDSATGQLDVGLQPVGATGAGGIAGMNNQATPSAAEPVVLDSDPSISGQFVALLGSVSQQVTSVMLQLPDGERPRLTPVSWRGSRWVGVVIPVGVRILRVVAYSGTRELAYAVPFRGVEVAMWLQPGQAGPTRLTKSIASGIVDGRPWHGTASIGPWGWCYVMPSGSNCGGGAPSGPPDGQLVRLTACFPANSRYPAMGLVFAAPEVRRVVLRLSDGTSASFRPVQVAGVGVFGYEIPANVQVTSSREYGSRGQLVGAQSGNTVGSAPSPGWSC